VGIAETLCGQTLDTEDVFEEGRLLSSMAETAGKMLEKPLFDGADSAKQILSDKLRDNDQTLVDSIKSLAGISGMDTEVKKHALVVCEKSVRTRGLKILKDAIRWQYSLTINFLTSIIHHSNICQLWLLKIKNI
jgi:hypothetical protein